ncbi:MAG TPA: YicC family protein [Gammaproteobacteria bacterium]|nr:YicC family protein [Gammaproteobacteria bacterium]
MTASMTAFARRETNTPWGTLIWELRTVNHRYLEPTFKLPEELRGVEPMVRERLAKRLGRGKVDCHLKLSLRESTDLEMDEFVVKRLLELAHKAEALAAHAGGSLGPWRMIDLLRWPGVFKTTAVDAEVLMQTALELLDQALDDLTATRLREGAQLATILRQRLDAMAEIAERVRTLVPEIRQNFRERLMTRLQDVRAELDPARLEQEMLLFAQKTDVDEELDRLNTHITEVRRVLDDKGQIGRRLDFLMQELNREANTLGSKASDVRVTNAAVDLKVLIEQMREQVQNIE